MKRNCKRPVSPAPGPLLFSLSAPPAPGAPKYGGKPGKNLKRSSNGGTLTIGGKGEMEGL